MARSHGEVMGQNLKNLKSRKTSRNPLFSCCCATSGGILDRAVEAEDKKHGDILRLDHFSSRSVPFFRIILRGEVVEHQNIANDLKFQQFIVYKPQNAGAIEGQIIKTIGFLNNFFLLVLDAKVFVPSYPKSLTELMGKSSILLINGSLQRRIHGLVGGFFKSPQLKAQITRDLYKYVQESMTNWSHDRPIYIQDETKNIAFQVLVKALINLDPGEEMESLRKQFQEFIAGLMSLPINIPGTRLHRSLQAKKKMVKQVKKILEARKTSSGMITKEAPRDVIDVLLNDTSGQLTDDLIADNIIDMMIPGEDSVPVLLTLAVKYLSDCPAALQQLLEENIKLKRLKDQLGEPLCWSDYLSLPFTQTVITETLRLGNIIIGVMRKAMKDVEIKGYLIPKGWCAFAYFRSVHLDENNYDWPYKFNPWRWQEKDTSSCNFTPFGGGQRLCPGIDLARLEASIFLHHFVTQFRWVAEEDTIVNFPTVRMKRRLPIWVKRKEGPL